MQSLNSNNHPNETVGTEWSAQTVGELNCLAKAVWWEARGEPALGQAAVAHVILARWRDARWPKSICAVIHQEKQFSDIDKARPKKSDLAYQIALTIAQGALIGDIGNPCAGAVFFYNPDIAKGRPTSRPVRECRVGQHVFLSEVGGVKSAHGNPRNEVGGMILAGR